MNASLRRFLALGERLGQRYALAIPQSAFAGRVGSLLGRQAGSSIDFQEHRDYQPGDDLRRIDWNIYARSDRLVVKLYREEVNPHLDLLLDGSRSMALPQTGKSAALCWLSSILAVAAQNAGCTHSVWLGQHGFRRLDNDRGQPSIWNGIAFEGTQSLAGVFHQMRPSLRHQGIRILLSDLLWPGDPLVVLRQLAQEAASVWVVQLLGREDVELPESGSLRLLDSETGEELDLYLDASAAEQYRQAMARHQQSWHQACRQTRARLITMTADNILSTQSLKPLEDAGLLVAS